MTSVLERATELLGGHETFDCSVTSESELESYAQSGLPHRALFAIAEQFGEDFVETVFLKGKSISGMSLGGRFTREESRRILDAALVLAHAMDVFGPPDNVLRWLAGHIRSLDGRRPMDLLALGESKSVDDTLLRIEHVVYL
jgi:putative toxin-antitoxin system antitoxin component (TIGR02293 family)